MNLLLDSQLLIWTARDPARLSAKASNFLTDPANDFFFSSASIWEIAIKHGRGRPDFDFDPRLLRLNLQDRGFEEVVVTGDHGAAVVDLPRLHKDPFDRLLVAQAIVEDLTLLTADRTLGLYPGPILRV